MWSCHGLFKGMCLLQPVKKPLCTASAGFTIPGLRKAVLTGGDERKQALQSAELTLEDIQVKIGRLAEAHAFMYTTDCKGSFVCSTWWIHAACICRLQHTGAVQGGVDRGG